MGVTRFRRMAVKVAMPCVLVTAMAGVSAQDLPREKTGVSNVETAKVELPAGFDMAKARNLRMRKVTILPGGGLPMHAHGDRPSVSYVLSGVLTEYVAGDATPRVIKAGGSNASFAQDHALANRGKVPVVFLEVDLITP